MNRRQKNQFKKRTARSSNRKQKNAQTGGEAGWQQKRQQLLATYKAIAVFSGLALFIAIGWWNLGKDDWRANFSIPREGWLRTKGTMQDVRMGYSSGKNGGWWVGGTYYYQVDGQKFVNDRLAFSLRVNEIGARSLYAHLHKAPSVTVFYEKDNPTFSTLYLPKKNQKYELIVVMVILTILFLFCLSITLYLFVYSGAIWRELHSQLPSTS